MSNFLRIFAFLLLSCSFLPQARAQYTISDPGYIGVDIPAAKAYPDELTAEYTPRFVYFSRISSDTSTEVDYQIDLYFDYITVRTTTKGNVTKFTQFYTKEEGWQDALQSIKNGLAEALIRLPKKSTDYANVSSIRGFVIAVNPPLNNSIGLVYGSTAGWLMNTYDIELYYEVGPPTSTIISFTNTEGFANYTPGGWAGNSGKLWHVQLDMWHNVVNLYYTDYPINPVYSSSYYGTPKQVISSKDPGWKQALLEVLLIAENGGLNTSALAASATPSTQQEIIANIQNYMAAH